MTAEPRLYGVLAEFRTADELLRAACAARAASVGELEAYTPFPVDGLEAAVGPARNRVALATLLGGIMGGAAGYFMQWYSAVVDFPINVGGRPLHSWPSFIPVTFELTILGAALTGVIAMLAANGLPRLRHPLFAVPHFDLASRNRFFLCVRARDRSFDAKRAHDFLSTLEPLHLHDVPS